VTDSARAGIFDRTKRLLPHAPETSTSKFPERFSVLISQFPSESVTQLSPLFKTTTDEGLTTSLLELRKVPERDKLNDSEELPPCEEPFTPQPALPRISNRPVAIK